MATAAAFCNAGAGVSSSLPERVLYVSEDVAFSSSREPSGLSRISSGGKKADSRFWQIPMIREPWSEDGLALISQHACRSRRAPRSIQGRERRPPRPAAEASSKRSWTAIPRRRTEAHSGPRKEPGVSVRSPTEMSNSPAVDRDGRDSSRAFALSWKQSGRRLNEAIGDFGRPWRWIPTISRARVFYEV